MGITRISHVIFALVLIGWGILSLTKGDFAPGWQPVPEPMPARSVLVYLCAMFCVACGVGLFWQRTAALAARVLFAWLLLWLLLLRVPWMFVSFGVNTWWSASSTAVITATAWVLYSSLADDWDRQHLGFVTGDKGARIARMLFGLGLIPFGLAHFLYLDATAPVVPAWLPWHVFWAYFTGGAFIAAGVAIITNIFARLAAALITLQIGLFTLLIWVPRALEGNLNAFQWGEFVVSIVLTACAWVVADSYRATAWLGVGINNRGDLP
jgi:uncharacterized membrane protein